MRCKAKITVMSAAILGAGALLSLVSPVQAESRWDGLKVTQFTNDFFNFESGIEPGDPLQERGIETDFSTPDERGSQSGSTTFYDRPRNVFETGGKER